MSIILSMLKNDVYLISQFSHGKYEPIQHIPSLTINMNLFQVYKAISDSLETYKLKQS